MSNNEFEQAVEDDDDPTQRVIDSGNYALSRLDYLADELRQLGHHLDVIAEHTPNASTGIDAHQFLAEAAEWCAFLAQNGDRGVAAAVRAAQADLIKAVGYGYMCGDE